MGTDTALALALLYGVTPPRPLLVRQGLQQLRASLQLSPQLGFQRRSDALALLVDV